MTATLKTTRDQLLAAEAAYNRAALEYGFQTVMLPALEPALDAALALVPAAGQESTPAPMTRAEALAKAQEVVDGWTSAQPERSRGIAGTTTHDLDSRATAVLRLAAFLTGTAGEV